MKSKEKTIEEKIIDLYLNIQKKKHVEVSNLKLIKLNVEKEKETLRNLNPKIILDYIQSSIDIFISMKVDELSKKAEVKVKTRDSTPEEKFEPSNEYEKDLRHLESQIRNHIRVINQLIQIEHQLKLHSDTLQNRVDELEKYNEDLKTKNKNNQQVTIKLTVQHLGKLRSSFDSKE